MDWATLRSITAYRVTDTDALQNSNRNAIAMPTNALSVRTTTTAGRTWTQELQLVSPASQKVKWIAGVFLLRGKSFVPTANGLSTTQIIAPTSTEYDYANQNTKSYAGFGLVTVPVGFSTNITGGFRYSLDDRGVTTQKTVVGTAGSYGAPTGAPVTTVGAANHTWRSATWRLALDHQFTPDVMGYVSYNRGFKAGLFNLIPFNPLPVNPERLDAYEGGLKSELFHHKLRLNAAAYYYTYDNMQVSATTVQNGNILNILLNAGAATIKGVDLSGEWAVTRRLSIRGGFSLVDGTYTRFPGASGFVQLASGATQSLVIDASGEALFKVPKYSGDLSASYSVPTDVGSFHLYGNAAYQSGYFFEASHNLRQAPTTMVNLGIDWTDRSERYTFGVYAHNIGGVILWGGQAAGGSSGLSFTPGKPRTFGAIATAKF